MYSCESICSRMKIIKSKYRPNVTDTQKYSAIQSDLKKLRKKIPLRKSKNVWFCVHQNIYLYN